MQLGSINKATWGMCIEEHHRLFLNLYGVRQVKPKHHQAMHYLAEIEKHTVLESTATCERKHKIFKRVAVSTTNDRNFDTAVTRLIVNHQVSHMVRGDDDEGCSLFSTGIYVQNLLQVPPATLNILPAGNWTAARSGSVNGLRSIEGDVVFFSEEGTDQVGRIEMHLHESTVDRYFSIVQRMAHIRNDVFHVLPHSLQLINLSSVSGVAIWMPNAENEITVLLPGALAWRTHERATI